MSVILANPEPDEPVDGSDGLPADTLGVGHLAAAVRRSGIDSLTFVPGAPCTVLIDALADQGATVTDAHDEKSAVEIAIGRAAAGQPSGVVIKGIGGDLAAEPLASAGPEGIAGPLVVLVGDDPHASASTVPTDVRGLGAHLHLPVFELADGASIDATVRAAVTASSELARPSIIRFTKRLQSLAAPAASVHGLPSIAEDRYDHEVQHRTSKMSRFEHYVEEGIDRLQSTADAAPTVRVAGSASIGILVSGDLTSSVLELLRADHPEVPALGLSCIHPLPRAAVEFAAPLEAVVIAEQGEPIVETELRLRLAEVSSTCEVRGQRAPRWFALNGPNDAGAVLRVLGGERHRRALRRVWKETPHETTHEFAIVFEALRDVSAHHRSPVYACVGSSIEAAYPPWQTVDGAYNLGSAINLAIGASAARGRQPAVALMGDYSLRHSGLSSHIEVYDAGWPVLTIILANGRSAKTGGQPTRTSRRVGNPLDLHRVLTVTGPPEGSVQWVHVDHTDPDQLFELMMEMFDHLPGTLVVESGDGAWRAAA